MNRPSKLTLQSLESRDVPSTVLYSAATQSLTITASDNDVLELRQAGPTAPAGYLVVINSTTGLTDFDSSTLGRPVRNILAIFSTVSTGSLLLGPAIRLGGNLTLLGARTSQTLVIRGAVGGHVSYTDIAGATDDVTFESNARVGGNVTLNLSEGANTTRFKLGTYGGNVSVSGKKGTDTVELLESGSVIVGGSANFNLGNGANTLTGMAGNLFTTGTGLNYRGGAGIDTISMDTNGSDFNVGGAASFSLGGLFVNSANSARFDSIVTGLGLSIVGGPGDDDVRFKSGVTIGGDFSCSTNDGSNYLDMNSFSTGTNTIGGKFTYTGGKNVDQVYMDGTTIGKSAAIDLKDASANGQFLVVGNYMASGVRVFGHFGVKSGIGADKVDLARLDIGGSLTVDTGAGADIIYLNDVFVSYLTRINLGAGDDQLLIETALLDANNNSLGGFSRFGGAVTVLGGIGDDLLNISNDSDATTFVAFGSKLTIDGGVGTDTLALAGDTVFFGGPVPVAF